MRSTECRSTLPCTAGVSIPIRMYLANYPLTPTMRNVEDRFSVRYYLNLVITDVDDNKYFKQQVNYRFVR